jgi:hypothetical protein
MNLDRWIGQTQRSRARNRRDTTPPLCSLRSPSCSYLRYRSASSGRVRLPAGKVAKCHIGTVEQNGERGTEELLHHFDLQPSPPLYYPTIVDRSDPLRVGVFCLYLHRTDKDIEVPTSIQALMLEVKWYAATEAPG